MKKIIPLFMLFVFSCFTAKTQNSPLVLLNAYIDVLSGDYCFGGYGALRANASGGVPPYTYQWSVGPNTQILSGLSAGTYDVTITDNAGATATAFYSISNANVLEFYAVSIVNANPGMNNGSVTTGIYPAEMMAVEMAQGTYSTTLFDSSNNLVGSFNEVYTWSCGCMVMNKVFDSLAPGHYNMYCSLNGNCEAQVAFDILLTPAISPSVSILPSCNGAPTGNIVVNSHPSPAITASTFLSVPVSNLPFIGDKNTTQWKVSVKNQGGTTVAYKRTRDSLFTIQGLLPGNYDLLIYSGDTVETFDPGNHDSVLVYSSNVIVTSDTTCSLVTGRLYADYNSDCIFNSGDIALKGTLVELNPGGFSSFTDSYGNYFIPVPVGTYTVKQYAPYYYQQLCPDTLNFTVSVTATGQIITVDIADSINTNPDVLVGISAGPSRPGFNQVYYLTYRNVTVNQIPSQTLTLDFDPLLTYIGSTLAPSSTLPSQLTWAMPALQPFGEVNLRVTLNIPASVPIGAVLSAIASVSNVAGESNLANNTDNVSTTVTGSFDPNDISVSPVGFDNEGYIPNDELLKYSIRFQNTGNDTAFTVVVVDTLPAGLDKYSIQVLDASHSYWYEFKGNNIVLFHFDNILLPDSNTNEEASHGFIKFSIEQNAGNIAGTQLLNDASIVFDFNAPVITNEVLNTVFDCNAMANFSISNGIICEGQDVSATSTLLFDMNVDWFVDGVYFSSDSTILVSGLSAGSHTIKLQASNSSCTQDIISTIQVNALPPQPVFTQSQGVLTSSVSTGNQWLLSGNLIIGASANTYTVTQSGWYSVLVTDLNGCTNTSDSVYVLFTGIHNLNSQSLMLVPNPAGDHFSISGLSLNPGDEIIVTDAVGKLIYRSVISELTNDPMINCSDFASGIYLVNIRKPSSVVILKLQKG